MKKAYLILNNGMVFEGQRIGADIDSIGELVFTTGMVGYIETLTDPSYAGQIVMQTFPLIGNYGVIEEDFEGDCSVKGYVVRELCDYPSNFRSEYELNAFLKAKGVCGICGVDTREITRLIRENGVMNAMICDKIPDDLSPISSYSVNNVVSQVSCKEKQIFTPQKDKKFSVTLIDYGTENNIIKSLCTHGCEVTTVPYDTSAEEILSLNPDGIVLSNGPGDPTENVFCIEQIKKLIGKVPVFGIGLGHQLAALAMGGKTNKLKHGHRGANQPVKEIGSGKTYITNQNHGYAVCCDNLPKSAVITFINANDGTCEGIEYPDKNCLTAQFYPEGDSGPRNTDFLFEHFIEMMGGNQNA